MKQERLTPGVYPTRRQDGLVLYRRFDGRRWYFGDPFKNNAAGAMQPVPPQLVGQLVADHERT